jgi:hypothetical protein
MKIIYVQNSNTNIIPLIFSLVDGKIRIHTNSYFLQPWMGLFMAWLPPTCSFCSLIGASHGNFRLNYFRNGGLEKKRRVFEMWFLKMYWSYSISDCPNAGNGETVAGVLDDRLNYFRNGGLEKKRRVFEMWFLKMYWSYSISDCPNAGNGETVAGVLDEPYSQLTTLSGVAVQV